MKQTDKLARYLKRHRKITPLEALNELGIFRLGARVYDLRQQGQTIKTRLKKVRTRSGLEARVAEYTLR